MLIEVSRLLRNNPWPGLPDSFDIDTIHSRLGGRLPWLETTLRFPIMSYQCYLEGTITCTARNEFGSSTTQIDVTYVPGELADYSSVSALQAYQQATQLLDRGSLLRYYIGTELNSAVSRHQIVRAKSPIDGAQYTNSVTDGWGCLYFRS
jgi:hypothetical protein